MPVSLIELGIDRMSFEDRLALVQDIWDTISTSKNRPPISDALRQELERRLADHRSNPQDVVPWEQVKAEAQARSAKGVCRSFFGA